MATQIRANTTTKPAGDRHWLAWLWLLVGLVSGIFVGTRWTLPICAWVAPVFVLRFLELRRGWIGFVPYVVGSAVSFSIANYGVIPLPGPAFYTMSAVVALVGYGLSQLHLNAIRRWPSGLGTLVFPCATVSLEYASAFGMFGTWSSASSSQATVLSIVQLASLTGIWGISFLVSWTVATLHWAWSRGFRWSETRRPVIAWGAVLVLVIAFGQARLAWYQTLTPQTVVASVVAPEAIFSSDKVRSYLSATQSPAGPTDQQVSEFQSVIRRRLDFLIGASQQAAGAGAKWIYWSEVAIATTKEGTADLDARASEFARNNSVFLGVAFAEWEPEGGRIHNLIRLWNPDGQLAAEYAKVKIPPGESSVPGSGDIPVVAHDGYRVANVICFDTDFPSFIRQASKERADILVAPSNDWPAAAWPHLAVASFRAVENGFSLVRATSQGISVALDPLGRTIAHLDSASTEYPLLIASVPCQRIPTLYSWCGDVFAWLAATGCVLAIIGLFWRC